LRGGVWIEIPADISHRLDALPDSSLAVRSRHFDRAVNAALDAEHWPHGKRGTVSVPCAYWYVALRKHGALVGHVGPLPSKPDAARVAASWRQTGARTTVMRTPIGPCLTNRFEGG
jgi:hypothetical protein